MDDKNEKRTRFRFSESETLQALNELLSFVCEDITISEDEMWKHIMTNLRRESASRFHHCSVRNLKEHMLAQVAKYKKYQLEESNESGRERLQTKWEELMQQLMLVWQNYEDLVALETVMRKNKYYRKEKETVLEKAKLIRAKALGQLECASHSPAELLGIMNSTEEQGNDEDYENSNLLLNDGENEDISPLSDITNHQNSENESMTVKQVRGLTIPARKKRNTNNNKEMWLYLKQMSELEKNRLEFEKQRFNMEMNLRTEAMNLKKMKLEFDNKKWEIETAERKQKWELEAAERREQIKIQQALIDVLKTSKCN